MLFVPLVRRVAGIVTVALLLSSCATEKYPYAQQFVGTTDVPPTTIAAPPAVGSAEFSKALHFVLSRQKKLSAPEIAVLQAENHISPEMIVLPVLGADITADKFPQLYTHLRHISSDAWRIGDAAQDHWGSPRPWTADARVHAYVTHITRPGYPSGHATTNTAEAYALGDLFPCKKTALLVRANAIGYHRIEAGAHFPFDVEGGKKIGIAIYNSMIASPDYQREHESVRAELQSGLPSESALAHCMVAGK